MTYLQLCQALRRESGISTADPTTVEGTLTGYTKRLADWIDRAWTEIQNHHDWEWMWRTSSQTLTIGTQAYQPNTDSDTSTGDFQLSPELAKWVTTNVRIKENTADEGFLSYVPWGTWSASASAIGTVTSARPTSYTIRPDDVIVLNTTPDKAYTLSFDYYRTPQTLSLNSDTPELPGEYHDIILYLALTYVGAEQDAPEVYQDAQAQYNKRLADMGVTQIQTVQIRYEPLA